MSPAYYSMHPFAMLFDCGLGSDPNYTGPCTGTSGTSSPEYLSASLKSSLASGKGEMMAIAAALMVLAALLVLVRMVKRAAKSDQPGSVELEGYVCRKCGSDDISGVSADLVVCGACGFAGNADYVGDDVTRCVVCGAPADMGVSDGGEHVGYCRDCEPEGLFDSTDDFGIEESAGIGEQDHEAQTGPGYTTCGICGFADDQENIDENGGVCNACRADYEENRWKEGGGIGGKDGFR